ncbi:MAG: hypothetical protein LKJ03_08715 [Enterococcaceae bacterium]|jgi:hypothetical protein|nr:hypothetical protein [Enterococcaceae bacterium]
MPYITFNEFKELTGKKDFIEEDFKRFLPKASAVLDSITNYFYQTNDLVTDPIKFRVNQFKLALCSQIAYFVEVGSDTVEGINKAPQSVNIGSTSVSNGFRSNSAGSSVQKSIIADDIYIYLEGTGLLYRGCRSC